jgi:hypothetical protein
MSVDTFWRRVNPSVLDGLDPPELRKLVPYWFDDAYEPEAAARITVGAEDTGALLLELLRLGAGDGPDAEAAYLAGESPEGHDDEYMIDVIAPGDVVKVAEFLSRATPAAWMEQYRSQLAVAAHELGYHRPFDDAWAQTVVTDTEELTELFTLAAAAAEAVIISTVA